MALPFGLNEALLNGIITASHDAVANMNNLNTQVNTTTSSMIQANQSDSGFLMQRRLNDWNGEFNQIIALLRDLNRDVENLRTIQVTTSGDATQTAQR